MPPSAVDETQMTNTKANGKASREVAYVSREVQSMRKIKLAQIRNRKVKRQQQDGIQQTGIYQATADNKSVVSDTSSGVNFSVYKSNQLNQLIQKNPQMTQNEVGPLTNFGASLIPPKFAIYNAPAAELADLKKRYSSKILFKREISSKN